MTGGMAPLVGSSSAAMAVKPNANMYLSIAVAMVGAMMFGLDQGNFGNVQGFSSFRKEWCYGKFGTRSQCAADEIEKDKAWADGFVLWGATLITFGAAAGAVALAPYLAMLGAGGAICFLGCLMASYLCFDSVPVFYIGRFITGFGVGVSCFALPVYNAEISTPSIRGATGSMFQLNVVIGCFFSTLITLFDHDWRFGMMLPGIAGGVLMLAAAFLPESPRFIFEKQGYEAGVRELEKIRSGSVEAEAEEIEAEIKAERNIEQVTFAGLFAESNLRKRVLIACTLVLGQQATGVNAFLGYAGTIFTEAGIKDYLLFNVIFNSIMIVGCTLGLLLVDSSIGGRRCQLLVASSIMGPPLVLAAVALQFNLPGLILMVCVVLYGVGFQVAWGTVPWIYPAEIFSMVEKEKAVSIAVCLNYLANAAVVMVTPFMMSASTVGTFYTYGILNIVNFVFVFMFVVETKGKPLEEIPALFSSVSNASLRTATSATTETSMTNGTVE
eukprot:CAMPEP_0179174948 /NCGR_PEP_ID=MMETSP0796-20121207/86384_1 /TAXON_ID=73915 /ORGANISM="Pyrodinium bahamense, Strain pbaha01" /LENGTH=497 /DNA_ID=CAMNT_0020878257 /DNA_START=84 /DNA_END=1578 /DNA_ORIENTATION=-